MSVSTPAISIIIAAYNEEKYLANCLGALISQLEPGDEIIVVDNNSSDNTAALARQHVVQVISEKQQGISFARNAGFNSANNEIIARTDADTAVDPHWLEAIRGYYAFPEEQRKLTAISGPVYLKELLPLKFGLHQGQTKKVLGHETLTGGNEALTRTLWRKIKTELSNDDATYMEDMEMAAIIARSGGAVAFLPTMTVYTSGRWMLRRPVHSLVVWRRKMRNTKRLLNLE